MALITNPKIGYKRFAGYSLLFDNPGEGNYSSHAGKLQLIGNQPGSIPFMDALRLGVDEVGEGSWEQHGLLQLEPASYHVTVWDGVNQANLNKVVPEHQRDAGNFLHGIPFSIRSGNPMMRDVADSPLAAWRGEMSYVFDRLAIIADYVLVALLKPADDRYAAVQRSIEHLRDELYGQYETHYGIASSGAYMPHLSLGYFLRHEDGRQAHNFAGVWNEVIKEQLKEADNPQLKFQSISLYGFPDMEHFYRATATAGIAPSFVRQNGSK